MVEGRFVGHHEDLLLAPPQALSASTGEGKVFRPTKHGTIIGKARAGCQAASATRV